MSVVGGVFHAVNTLYAGTVLQEQLLHLGMAGDGIMVCKAEGIHLICLHPSNQVLTREGSVGFCGVIV